MANKSNVSTALESPDLNTKLATLARKTESKVEQDKISVLFKLFVWLKMFW